MSRRGSNLQDKFTQKSNSASTFPQKSDSQSEKKQIRLQVYLSHCGVSSRRAAEKIIQEGRVSVNGQIVRELGTKVCCDDKILVDGKKIKLEEKKRYVLLNKPAGFVCSSSDEKGRSCAWDLLKGKYSERLYNVGRLDMYSKGMIIFTNDGEFAAKLSHPSSQIEKEYIVETSQDIPQDFPEKFEKGIRVEGKFYKCLHCEILKPRKIKIILIEGKNREIRNVLDSQNIGTKSLVRVRIGNVKLDDLKPGEFRDLTKFEIQRLISLCENKNL